MGWRSYTSELAWLWSFRQRLRDRMRQHEDRHLEFVALCGTVRLSHLVSSPAHHDCSSRSNRFLKLCVCAQAPFRVQTPHRARTVSDKSIEGYHHAENDVAHTLLTLHNSPVE